MLLDAGTDARSVITAFGMRPHPEGGWYVESFRAAAATGARPVVSAIYFLLQKGERSAWHTVDAAEIWLWHAGAPARLNLADADRHEETQMLGPAIEAGERPHIVVPQGVWQSAESSGAWTLVTCVVAPAFEFPGFRLAPEGWSPGSPTPAGNG